ncbi:MAG: hypothetical protein AAGJ37_18165 [Pseudomonadota bacterium]
MQPHEPRRTPRLHTEQNTMKPLYYTITSVVVLAFIVRAVTHYDDGKGLAVMFTLLIGIAVFWFFRTPNTDK